MNGLFVDLENQSKFVSFVGAQLSNAPTEISAVMRYSNICYPARLAYAASEYQQNINKFAVLLDSNNPDHYKRAGSLLHALYQSKPIV